MWLRKSTLPGALYLILTIAFPVAGLSYFFAPKVERSLRLQHGGAFVRLCGAGRAEQLTALVPLPPLPAALFLLQTTLFHVLGYVYGKSTAMVWKGIGAGLLTVLPAISWTLKVGGRQRVPHQRCRRQL